MTKLGKEMHDLANVLFPICRSLTGEGVRETLKIISREIPIKINEVPTGTKVFDWSVPKEWNIRDAYIITPDGEKICEFKKIIRTRNIKFFIPMKRVIPCALVLFCMSNIN